MAPRRPATLQDVADLSGVTRGTASRALSGGGRVSTETRARVRAAAERLRYAPNSGARNLRRARAGAVGLWLPSGLRFVEYYMHFTFGLVEAMQDEELTVSLIPEGLPPRKVAGLHVDGFVLADVDGDDDLARAILEGTRPTVSSEQVPPGMPAATGVVAADHASATRRLLEALRDGGATSIGIIAPLVDQTWASEALRAADAWSAETQVEIREVVLHAVPDSAQLGGIVRDLLVDHPRTDAILCLPEGLGIGVLAAIQSLGRSVPGDMQLACYTDGPSLEIVTPPISAIDLRPREAGVRAGRMLTTLIGGSEAHAVEWLDLPYHERGSTRRRIGT